MFMAAGSGGDRAFGAGRFVDERIGLTQCGVIACEHVRNRARGRAGSSSKSTTE